MTLKTKISIILFIFYLSNFSYSYSESINKDYIPIVSLNFPNHAEWKNLRFVAYQEKKEKKKDYFCSKPIQLWAIFSNNSKGSFYYNADDGKYAYNYLPGNGIQLFITQIVERKDSHPDTILFTPIFSGEGSGYTQLVALLVPDVKKGKFKNLLPQISITNLGEWQFIKFPLLSQWKVLVTADFILGERETHYSSHKYRICLYTYSQKEQKYRIFDKYETKERYDPLEGDVTPLAPVIEQEMGEIISRLKGKIKKYNPGN